MNGTAVVLESVCERLYAALAALQEPGFSSNPAASDEGAPSHPGGIRDPLDGEVVVHHYATSHFAWGAALRHLRTGDRASLGSALAALDFVRRTSVSRFAGEPAFHWDFKNLAYAETLELLGSSLPDQLQEMSWKSVLGFRQSRGLGVNWFAMRSLFFALAARGAMSWKARSWIHLIPVLLAIRGDGGIDDFHFRSRPIQYSVYTACLLERHPLLGKRVKRGVALRAARYLQRYILPTGQFNYRGRGHEQIFGYGAAVYLLTTAVHLCPSERRSFEASLALTLGWLAERQESSGLFPLILNRPGLPPRWGFYDYHHSSVYNAFLYAWLELSLRRLNSPGIRGEGDSRPIAVDPSPASGVSVSVSRASGAISVVGPSYRCFFARGESRYLADCGISPHVIWSPALSTLFACPGGPTARRHGGRHRYGDVTSNFVAPLFRELNLPDWTGPALGRPGALRFGSDWVRLSYRTDPLRWTRTAVFKADRIEFHDRLAFVRAVEGVLRVFNFPLARAFASRIFEAGFAIVAPSGREVLVEFESPPAPVVEAQTLTENPLGECRTIHLELPQGRFNRRSAYEARWSLRFPSESA